MDMQPGCDYSVRLIAHASFRLKSATCCRLILSVALVLVLLGGWPAAYAQKPQVTGISQCGTLITLPGTYQLTKSLQSPSFTVDCIRIKASAVSLNLGGFNITGPFGQNVTAAGIRILDSASGVQIGAFGSTIEGFAVGILVEGTGVSLLGPLVVTENLQQGVLVNHANNVVIQNLSSGGNAGTGLEVALSSGVMVQSQVTLQSNNGYGLWVHSSSGNQFFELSATQNLMSGIYVGESGALSSGADKSPATAPAASQQNIFLAGGVIANGGSGIVIGSGDTLNYIVGMQGQSNGATDAVDQNGDCTHNTWTQNMFATKNPACIQ
jgi:hypothetical protein